MYKFKIFTQVLSEQGREHVWLEPSHLNWLNKFAIEKMFIFLIVICFLTYLST